MSNPVRAAVDRAWQAMRGDGSRGLGSLFSNTDQQDETQDARPRTNERGPGNREEPETDYHLYGLHPVYIGDVYNHRYEVKAKLGRGATSTVWLVKDLQCRA